MWGPLARMLCRLSGCDPVELPVVRHIGIPSGVEFNPSRTLVCRRCGTAWKEGEQVNG